MAEMAAEGERFVATIDDGYTKSPYALMYFFSLHTDDGDAWLSPGLDVAGQVQLAAQPYHVIRQLPQ